MSTRPTLRLLGTPHLLLGDGAVAPLPAKAYVLAALLGLAYRGPTRRTLLARTLWEDADEPTAAAAFRKLVSRIKSLQSSLGIEIFALTAETIALGSTIAVDVVDLAAIAEIGTLADLNRVADLYRGELLRGRKELGPKLEQWLASTQSRLADDVVGLVLDGVSRLGGAGVGPALSGFAAQFPYSDAIEQARMRYLAHHQSIEAVRASYHDFTARRAQELRQSPEKATDELFAKLTGDRADRQPLPARPRQPLARAASQPHLINPLPRLSLLRPTIAASSIAPEEHAIASAFIEDVTIALTGVHAVAPVAPHSSWEFSRGDGLEAARRYKVDYIVDTRLDNRNGLRLSVKLIRVATRDILWAERLDFSPEAQTRAHDELARQVVRMLVMSVEREELRVFSTTRDPGAYASYLWGLHNARTLDLRQLRKARKSFHAAANAAPNFAGAHNGVARTLTMEWLLTSNGDTRLLTEAESFAKKAIALDPTDGVGFREMGSSLLFQNRLDESLQHFAEAEIASPHHADMLADYADALMHNSEPQLARAKLDRAIALNPTPPDDYRWIAGGVDFFLEDYVGALDQLKAMQASDAALRLMAACAAMLGDNRRAGGYRRKAMALNPSFRIDDWLAVLPQRDRHHLDHYSAALRAAGFH